MNAGGMSQKAKEKGLTKLLKSLLMSFGILITTSCGELQLMPGVYCEKVVTESSKPHCKVKAEMNFPIKIKKENTSD